MQREWEIGHSFSETKHWRVFEGWREKTESLQKIEASVNGLLHLLIMRPALRDFELWHQVDEGLQVLEEDVPGLWEGDISKGHK